MKRFCDLILVLITAPLWLPLMAATAIASACCLGFPVLFHQERAGKGGHPFRLHKFRSMRTGTGTDAERLTRYGRFLRASSLDELPELFNVLAGEMSLVGPRPLPTRYLPRYTAEQNRRHEVLPGITGWAQVNGRNALGWEEKFRYDVEYVVRRSLAMDFKILWRTLAQVVCAKDVAHPGEATMSEFIGTEKTTPMSQKFGNVANLETTL